MKWINEGKRSFKDVAKILNISESAVYAISSNIDYYREHGHVRNGNGFNYEKNVLLMRLVKNLSDEAIEFFKDDKNFKKFDLDLLGLSNY